MRDSDRAEHYEAEIKALNQAVKRNIERFGRQSTSDYLLLLLNKSLVGSLLLILLDTTAMASNFSRPTLEQLVSQSRVIVVATPENPPTREREIHFKSPPDKSALPYKQTLFRYRVNEALLGEIPSGTIIEVVEANTRIRQRESYNYDVSGMTMSIVRRRYVPQYPPAENTPLILFLRGSAGDKDSGLEFIAQGGLEGVQAHDEVVRLIAQRFGNFSRP